MQMRVLIDRSCVEIYLSSGEVLSTRVYRGQQPVDSDAGIDFVAFGGTARVEVTAHFTLPHLLLITGSGSFQPACYCIAVCTYKDPSVST